ncbi:MAG: D-alanine--D-alanine ligase [Patescibacteria group bacterium]
MKTTSKGLSFNTRVAVVYGGKSKERPGSLISGKAVCVSLKKQGYKNIFWADPAQDNFIKKINNAEAAFLILHGRYGEDGKIQGYLETIGIPYTGSGILASALGMDKFYFKTLLAAANIPTPPSETLPNIPNRKNINIVVKKLGIPLFLKPFSEGGSLGSNVIHTKAQLINDITKFKNQGFDKFLAEKYIDGRALTVGVLQNGNKIDVLPILETISKKEFCDYEAKHNPRLHTYKCPASLKPELTNKIKVLAESVFKLVGCFGFCRVDFILDSETNTPFVLEINTLPGMSPNSNMATSAKAAKISYDQLVIKMLETAYDRPKYLP